MTFFRLGLLLVMAAALLAAGPALASSPTGDDCYGKSVELKCHNMTTRQWCGTMAGTSCYDSGQNLCAAQSATAGCSAECDMKKDCNQLFPECCQGNCGLYYKFGKGGWEFEGRCPDYWKP